MPHFCRICGRYRPNEKFSGRGHKMHVCQDCMRRPKAERQAAEDEEEIYGFLSQSNISSQNLGRLETLAASGNQEIAHLARLVLEVGRAHPLKKGRLRFLQRERRDLIEQLEATGLLELL
jgi:hypothetical protein